MAAGSSLDAGHVVNGRCRVERQIGAGGVGSVYLVRHVHTDEQHALKVLQSHALKDAGALERFRKEARVAARISSEHVVRVTDADTAPDLDNAPFLVMELLRGNDLTGVVQERGPLPPRVVVEILEQAARALDKAHGLGIVHRDLKPDNLFLTQREDGSSCVKVLDFGIARIAEAEGMPAQMKTQAGLVFGTPGYMAPEQMTGEPDLVSAATDVWALGLVAYYLLVGSDFWSAPSLPQLYALILSGPIPRPSERAPALPPAFDAWFEKTVAREPKDRFQTAGEAATALATVFSIRASSPPMGLPPFDRVSLPKPNVPGNVTLPPPPPALPTSPEATVDTLVDAESPLETSQTEPDRRSLVIGAAITAVAVGVLGALVLLREPSNEPSVAAQARPEPHTTSSADLVPFVPVASAWSVVSATVPSSTAAAMAPRAADPQDPAPAPMPRDPVTRTYAPRGAARREQQDRLDALQRLCDQGTVTAAECTAKRAAILRGDP